MSTKPHASLTLVGNDLDRLMELVRITQNAYAVTLVHTSRPLCELHFAEGGMPDCAIVRLCSYDSAMDLRELFERAPGCRFVFVADELPLRHAVARVIHECGHVVVSRDDSPMVVAATATALIARMGAAT
jgi:hypothetical protein